MKVQNLREVGCPARGNHDVLAVGPTFLMEDVQPSKPRNTFFRLINGSIGVRCFDGRTRILLDHPRMAEIEENLRRFPTSGGVRPQVDCTSCGIDDLWADMAHRDSKGRAYCPSCWERAFTTI